MIGLIESKDKKIDVLSGGMKRRVSLGLSLLGNSKLIFLGMLLIDNCNKNLQMSQLQD